ncbi:MAG: methylcrotonoyl-CoA carboxylase [Prolixibacteraceae bacterium]|nr:methylcrotonoyl-CoA carboxylase [Prolixibacteraceae bacterium]
MKRLTTNIKTTEDQFKEKVDTFKEVMNIFHASVNNILCRDKDPAVIRHRERGKLDVRSRIELLVDECTPFLELSVMAAFGQYDDQFPSAGIVTGIGRVHGKMCIIIANDATVKGGTYIRETVKKHLRAQEIALRNHLPCIYLVDSGGIFLPEQANIFPDHDGFGRIFYNQAQMSAEGIPQLSIVMGSCTAGGAYVPAMSDETIIVRNQGTIFIGGPPLVKAATGEEVSAEELGGALVHTSISGVADHLAESEVDAIRICRNIFELIPANESQPFEQNSIEEPVCDPNDIYGIAPVDLRKPFDILEIIARITDGSKFEEFKQNYGTTLVTGYARIMGFPVGIIANNGFLTSEASLKGAHFIELCNFRKIPLLFLQNISGFIVGKRYEHEGIARNGAKLIHAVATAAVPKITVIIGGSFGAGNYAMAGRAYNPDFLFMWPNARIGVMGGQQAQDVINSIKGNNNKDLVKKFEDESSAYFSTSRLWDDGIIDPIDTRAVVGLTISIASNKKTAPPRNGVFRM